MKPSKPVILTGVRANNDIHIGNYFGAILSIVDMAKRRSADYDINLFIPDLHSFTTPIDHSKLYDSILNNARIYTAAGLPLDNSSIHFVPPKPHSGAQRTGVDSGLLHWIWRDESNDAV
ncbi:hypothetical protein KOY48_02725 [Candidatus Minimicrobia naudis]|uniref:Tryptophan--tRNA ligase n=1 Tax=Candidatus Minimicrobia naudis TaxID=2841263 RepID=A0A8F1SC79_9BACT|nr:hypothetical protein KOY48_02725 [Candidatus Minimicrobia naudis]